MDENFLEKRILGLKKEKKRGIILLCWPLFIFGLWFIASLIFWLIVNVNGDNGMISVTKNFVNWIFGLLLLFYFVVLPVGIVLVVDASNCLKKIKKG